jgi:hypothetical protein
MPAVSVTVGEAVFRAAQDDEINQIWKQVEERVLRMSGSVEGSSFKNDMSLEEVMALVKKTQAADREASESNLLKVFNQTLNCIQTVGGVVADGVSYV